jgi:DNA-binding MarR family transcriptional regulator
MKLTDSEKFLIHEKTFLALLFIYQKEVTYISEVSENIDSTFSHTNKIIKRLEELGYISSVFVGRTRFLQLTPHGYHYAQQLNAAFEICRSEEIFEFPQGYVPTRKEEKNETVIESDQSVQSTFPIHFDTPSDSGSFEKSPAETHTLAGRIQLFCYRIQEIFEEQTDAGADSDTLLQKLGPYDRELKMIGREIEKLEPSEPSAFVLTSAYHAAEMQYKFYLGKE